MSKIRTSSRTFASRFALIAIIGGLLLSFAGAAANAANFSLIDSMRGFFGYTSANVQAIQPKLSVTDGDSPQAGSVSLAALGSAYTQNFDTLSNVAGSTTNVIAINGWDLTETGGGARDNEQYAVDTGASNTGDTYSYGAAASTERALGALRSGSLIPVYGASFTNNTGSTITSLDIAYTGEEWRLGTTARTDQINFEYSTNASDLTTGTWTGVAALNFVTPETGTTGAKDGNAAANRTAISSTIPALSIPNGAVFWIRWTDTDATSSDDGLSVDDFSLTPNGVAPAPEMGVSGNGNQILDGDPSPTLADGTDFGSLDVSTGSQQNFFLISNTGNADLILGLPVRPVEVGGYVQITGDVADFTVTQDPISPIPSGSPSTFAITFNPTTTGLRTATVTIPNNDADENPYNFAIQGTGTAATPTPTDTPTATPTDTPTATPTNTPTATPTATPTPGSTPTFSVNDVSLNEGNGGTTTFTFTITKTGNNGLSSTIYYYTQDGTASGSGGGGDDYVSLSGPPATPESGCSPIIFCVEFLPGDTTKTVDVTVNGDTMVETNETFSLFLFNAINGEFTDSEGTGTIVNDDVPGSYALYGVSNGYGNPENNEIYQIDASDGDIFNKHVITIQGYIVRNAVALAARPSDGILFAVLNLEGQVTAPEGNTNRHLVTIDPSSGDATDIGILSRNIASIAFRPSMPDTPIEGLSNTLYGISGNNGAEQRTVFIINTNDATLTTLYVLSNGGCGQAIAFADDGYLYHASGGSCWDAPTGNSGVFERVNPDTGTTNFVGPVNDEVFALGYSSAFGQMFINEGFNQLGTISLANGARNSVGDMSDQLNGPNRGLAFTQGSPQASISLVKTVGLDPKTCGNVTTLNVAAGTTVYYCYTVTNTGSVTLTNHTLTDDVLGYILEDFPYILNPGQSAFVISDPYVVTDTITNTATWAADTGGGKRPPRGTKISGEGMGGGIQAQAMSPVTVTVNGTCENYAKSTPAFNFTEINATGTNIPLGDDQVSGAIPVGFNFNYFGTNYSDVYVSSNGFLTVLPGQDDGCCSGAPMTTPGDPSGVIAPFWNDLNPGIAPMGGGVFYQTTGAPGNRVFIVEYKDVSNFGSSNPDYTFQAKLFENGNAIEFHYVQTNNDGSFGSAGIENETGTKGKQFYLGSGSIPNNTAVRYSPCGVATPTPTPVPGTADLAITKTDGVTNITAPGTTTYTIVVTNNGPQPAVDAIVQDLFPAGVIVDNWSCLPQNEAFCTLAGAGNINDTVYIPVGGILTYTALARINANQVGTLVNTATVTAPPTVIDPNLANNTSTDTDNFVVALSGNVKQYVAGGPNTNLAGVTMTLSGSSGATTTTDASGNYSFTNLAAGGSWTVTPSMSGKVFDTASRTFNSVTANVTGINFLAYNTNGIPRNISVVNSLATPGNAVTVPIRMTSQGTEKTMAFSLDYPLGVLNTPVVTCGASTPGCAVASNNVTPGKLGVTITAAAPVAAGLREIANITFQTNVGFAPPNAALTFNDTPTARIVKDPLGDTLQATYTDGFVIFVDGVEGDVVGRPSGDGTVVSTDVTQIRRFVAGIDTPNASVNEFQRADVAPLLTGPVLTWGDGLLLPGDVVQARRYSARLDLQQAAAGPNGAALPPIGPAAAPVDEMAETDTQRALGVTTANADPGSRVSVNVELAPQGDEAALSFTLAYDASRLRNPQVTLASGMSDGAVLTVNSNDADRGRIGVLIDSSEALAVGSAVRQLVTVTFDVAENAAGGAARIRLTDGVAPRSMASTMGSNLTARYTDGAVIISGPASAGVELSGRILTPDGRGLRNATVTIIDAYGYARTVTTSSFGYYRFDGVTLGDTYTIGVSSRSYHFGARTVTVTDNLADVDLTAVD